MFFKKSSLQPREEEIDLAAVDGQVALGPDDEVGAGEFLVGGELGGDALGDFGFGPASLGEALALGRGGAGDADGAVELRLSVGFEEERDDDYGAGLAFGAPGIDLPLP